MTIKDDLFDQLSHERRGSTRLFRDDNTIFAVRYIDCGWVGHYQIYSYDINARKLRPIATIPEAETVESIYSAK